MNRRAWLYVASGYVVMAVGLLVFGFLLQHQVHRIDATQRQIKATQRRALATQRQIRATQQEAATIAVHNAGATCTLALKPSLRQRQELIESFLKLGVPITRFFERPRCVQVARKAARDIFDGQGLPPALERELGR